jgi:hypothetical protein
MPIIGATQLEPIAPVSNFLSGMQTARNALLQQQEAMRAQQRMDLEQRRFQREEDTAAAEAQNALVRKEALATGDPMAMFKVGATREAADYVSMMSTQEDQEYTRKKRGLEELSQQAGAFARNPIMLAPEYVDAWAQNALSRNIISPQAYEQLKSTYGNPRATQGFFAQLRDQGLTVAQQLENDRAARTAAIQEQQGRLSEANLAEQRRQFDVTRSDKIAAAEAEARQLAGAKATGEISISPKEIQEREAVYPRASRAFTSATDSLDALISDLKELKEKPGLSSILGGVEGRAPSFREKATEAQTLYDSIVARGSFSELQAMRDASPTGGALGQVAVQELEMLRSAFAALGQTQGKPSFVKNVDKAIARLEKKKNDIAKEYALTYAYRQLKAAPSGGEQPAAFRQVPAAATSPFAGAVGPSADLGPGNVSISNW